MGDVLVDLLPFPVEKEQTILDFMRGISDACESTLDSRLSPQD